MLLTEQDARQKQCCMACGTYVGAETAHRNPEQYPHGAGHYCAASACMAWRWHDPVSWHWHACANPTAELEPPRPELMPASWIWISSSEAGDGAAGWAEPKEEAQARRRGFCGLVGRAEV